MALQRNQLNKALNLIIISGMCVMVGLPLALIIPGVPDIWYRIDASAVGKEVEYLTQDLGHDAKDFKPQKIDLITGGLPPEDRSLPSENRVRIPSIKVDGKIYEGTNAERTLALGVWRTHNFGTPENNLPTILASHRYGNPNWSKEFRDREIFYHLDKVKSGDIVEVVWRQRLYRFRVAEVTVDIRISDSRTDADLILYTCNYWNSPKRIFAYAYRI